MARTAIITGAAQGIGEAIALQLAKDGCNVVLNDLASKQAELQALVDDINAASTNPKTLMATYVLGDVSVEADVKAMVEVAVATFGALDIMIANAGVVLYKSMIDASVEEFNRVLAINVRGTFLCTKFAGEQMIKQGNGGRIIAASSVSGRRGFENASLYCTSKFAIGGIVQCAALEFGPHKITVNAYAPGLIRTPMCKYIRSASMVLPLTLLCYLDGYLDEASASASEFATQMKQRTALKEIGTPQYVADAVSFLASEKACYITGETLMIDAGMVLV